MASHDVTLREALLRLGASTAEAVARALEMFVPGEVQRGDVTVFPEKADPFADVRAGSIATSVSYVDGVTGANVFAMTPSGARALAGAMGVPPPEEAGSELTELELSAVAEAANQMMAAAASAISVVIGQEIGISPPDTRVLNNPRTSSELFGTAPHATSTSFSIAGETSRLIQLIPSGFVMRMVRALDERPDDGTADTGGSPGATSGGGGEGADQAVSLRDVLSETRLRVWPELGRAQLPIGDALGLPFGAVVDLDRPADAPVDVFVNGLRFAQGHLLVTDDGEWAVRLDTIWTPSCRRAASPEKANMEGAVT